MNSIEEKNVRILLVEDEEAHAALVGRAFSERAPAVILAVAHSLEQARASLATTSPDLIISDLRLPDGDGVELLPADRSRSPYAVVIMTSHGDEQVAVEAMKAGALDYVVKTEATLAEMPRIAERALREWGHITERRRAEEAAQQAQKTLLHQQRREKEHIEQELKKAKYKLIRQTRLATIGQVAASIAHELRNPLGAVRNANYFLQRRMPGDDPKWTEYLTIIEREIGTAERIISTFLEMSRAKEPTVQAVDLNEAVRRAIDRIEGIDRIDLRCTLEPDPFIVKADPAQLQQVLVNLLTNAVQAMNGTGTIDVTAALSEDFDTITIRDHGPGIAEKVRDEIFEPLFTTKAKGTGLGLAICRQLVERHGGTLDLVEMETNGAAFRIRLPRQSIEAMNHAIHG